MDQSNEKELSPTESLQIIGAMINTARSRLAEGGYYFILWGWLVFIAAMINYVSYAMRSHWGEYAWWLMILGAVLSVRHGKKSSKKQSVRTYIDAYLGYCWIAFAIALALTLAFMGINGYRSSYFFLMILYGVATIVSGGLLDFKPLVIGGALSFVFAAASMFTDGKNLLLCLSGALLCSYIIPGHLLQARFKSQKDV